MSYTFKGKWKWNDVVYPLVEGDAYRIECEFVSNGRNIFCIAYDEGDDSQHARVGYLRYDDGINIITVAQNPIDQGPGVGVYDEWRVMDFGEGCVIENEEYCEFLLANIHELTMSEKLKLIVENEQRVYDSGYGAGKEAEHDAFWDAFQGATRRRWSSSFQYECWNDTTFYPKYDLVISGDAASLFRYCGITDLEGRLNECGVTLDTSECTNLNSAFGECNLITAIPPIDVSKCTASNATTGLFAGCISLKTVRKFIVSEETQFSNTFQNCPLLENIVFEGVIAHDLAFAKSTKLTRASIESIVNHLSDTVSGKTLTLSKAAVDREFEGISPGDFTTIVPGSESVDWYSMVNIGKPNWEIILI